jgi:hypothetical protein
VIILKGSDKIVTCESVVGCGEGNTGTVPNKVTDMRLVHVWVIFTYLCAH